MTDLDRLPPDQRAVLSLVLERGRSYGEVAEMLAIPRARYAIVHTRRSTRLPTIRLCEATLTGQSLLTQRIRARLGA